jgi:signal transduction histidine kinase/CheY-like chemotaxis protein
MQFRANSFIYLYFLGLVLSSFIAFFVYQGTAARSTLISNNILHLKTELIRERLMAQEHMINLYAELLSSSSTSKTPRIEQDLANENMPYLLAQYWIEKPFGNQVSNNVVYKNILKNDSRFSESQLVKLKNSVLANLDKVYKEGSFSLSSPVFAYEEIVNDTGEKEPLLLVLKNISDPMGANGNKSRILIHAVDFKTLSKLLPENTAGGYPFLGWLREYLHDTSTTKDYLYQDQAITTIVNIPNSEPARTDNLGASDKRVREQLTLEEDKSIVSNVLSYKGIKLKISIHSILKITPFNISAAVFLICNTLVLMFIFMVRRGIQLQKKTAEEETLRHIQQEKDSLINILAHELRTPLNGILGMVGFLLKTNLSTEQKYYASAVSQSGQIMNLIVDQSLANSHIEFEKITLLQEPMTLNELANELLDTLGALAQIKNVNFFYEIPKELNSLTFITDKLRLRQILINLIGNSIKFTERGLVKFQFSMLPNKSDILRPIIQFDIYDSGIGIEKTKRDLIFKQYGRLKNQGLKSNSVGGLGLNISQKLVRLLGGAIQFESEYAVGSHFYFSIPMTISEQVNQALPVKEMTAKRIVILAQKNQASTDELKSMLEAQGAHVEVYDQYLEIRKYFLTMRRKLNLPDLIFMQEDVGEIKGLKYFRDIQEWSNLDLSTRVIYLHTSTDITHRAQIFADGIRESVLMPIKSFYICKKSLEVLDKNNHELIKRLKSIKEELQGTIFERQYNILVADDHQLNTQIMLIMLESLGYFASVASNGNQVLQMLENDDYDCILMDINMPELNGIEATQKIRSSMQAFKNIPIIAMSANISHQYENLCLESGMDGYLTKPVEITVLERKIMEILSKNQ